MVRKIISIFILVGLAFGAEAQNLTRSPYSAFGVGDLQFNGFAQQQSLGRITQGVRSFVDYSISNPASYSALRYTSYQVGMHAIDATFENSTQSQHTQTMAFGYFSLGFPIKSKGGAGGLGAVFGLQPYSAIGYSSFSNTVDTSTGFYQNVQEGSGGLNRFYAGLGWRITPKISIGFNASYMFGQLITTDKVYFNVDSSYLDYREDRTRFAGGLNFDVGIQLHDSIGPKEKDNKIGYVIGATYHLGSNINASQQLYARTVFRTATQDFRRDTVLFTDGQQGTLAIPEAIRFGVGFGNGSKKRRWFLSAEYFTQNWKEYTSFGNSEQLSNLQSASLGFSYQPEMAEYETDVSKKYYKFVNYKLGFRYANTRLTLNNTQLTEYGINFGLSLPVKPFKRVSYLHLGVEYNSRGSVNDNLIRENYYRFVLGFTLVDRWFRRYKYD
jgi:hypothetical protein